MSLFVSGKLFYKAGEGSGGGGSVDESKVIVLSATIPVAGADTLGKFYCYKGVTNQNYTHGYVYECIEGTPVYTGTVSFEPATLSETVVSCSGDDFANFLTEAGADPTSIVSGTMTYEADATGWRLVGKDSNGDTVTTFLEYVEDYEDLGFTFTGTPEDGDVVAFTCTVESSSTYTWSRVNLQPGSEHDFGFFDTVAELQAAHPTGNAGDFALVGATDTFWVWDTTTSAWVDSHKADAVTSVNGQTGDVSIGINDILPDQTGHSGHVLGTDGFVAGWVVPEKVQRSVMPQASEDEEGNIYQFVGTTDATYTNGYFYKCVSDGGNPATYSWERTDVQPGSSLPSQTGNAGKFLVTDGTGASWDTSVKQLRIKTSSFLYCDFYVVSPTGGGTGIYFNSGSGQNVQLGGMFPGGLSYISKLYVREIYYGSNNSQGITVPAVGGTMVVADYTGATQGQVLTLNSSGNAEWVTPSGGGSTGTTASLVVADWSSNTQTVNVTGVTASNNVIVAPAPASQADYTAAGIICTAQGAGTLTFTCTTVPSSAITVNVLILG